MESWQDVEQSVRSGDGRGRNGPAHTTGTVQMSSTTLSRGRRLLPAAALSLLMALAAAASANATVPSGNLLSNGDAEAGACNAGSGSVASVPGWTTTGGFTVTCYGGSGFQPTPVSTAIGGGNQYFFGGNQPTSTATQTVDVSGDATEIDAGGVIATLSGYLGGFDGQDDNMVVTATFLDGSDGQLGDAFQIGPVLAADRSSTTTLLARSASAAVPAGTRSIQVVQTATRTSGSDNDGSADNLALALNQTSVTGSGNTNPGSGPVNAFTISAANGSGTLTYTDGTTSFNGTVVCMTVIGNAATIVAVDAARGVADRTMVQDNGASGDKLINVMFSTSKLSAKSLAKYESCIDPDTAALANARPLTGDAIQVFAPPAP
jgi:hypothetical protein